VARRKDQNLIIEWQPAVDMENDPVRYEIEVFGGDSAPQLHRTESTTLEIPVIPGIEKIRIAALDEHHDRGAVKMVEVKPRQ